MKNFNIRIKITIGFTLIVLLFLFSGILTIKSINGLSEDSKWVEHTHKVLTEIERTIQDLVNAETGQRGFLLTQEVRYLEPYNKALDDIVLNLSTLESLTADNPKQQIRISKLKELIDKKLDELAQTIQTANNESFEAALVIVKSDIGKSVMDDIRKVLAEMEKEENTLLEARNTKSERSILTSRLVILTVSLFSVLLVILLVIYFTRIIAYPLKKLASMAEKISEGDLTSESIKSNTNDEVGLLAKSFNTMQQKLKTQLNEIQEGVSVLSSSASEIMASVAQLSSGAAETATSVSETTSTIAEVKQTAEVSNYKAKEVSEGAEKSTEFARNGRKAIAENMDGMEDIKQQMGSIAELVIGLSDNSQSISDIISTVNELAEQTNLLSVNAAIEAAKAGEHGKGFNVVSQEIKLLSSRSKESTRQIKTILNDIQKSISNTVMATEQGMKTVESGIKLGKISNDAIEKLAEKIEDFTEVAIQISASSQQQLVGMDQINDAMETLTEASAETAASTKQSENSVAGLKELGLRLQGIVKQYKLS